MPLGRGAIIDLPVVKEIAIKHQVSAGQVLLRFCLDHEVLPLVKSSNIERIRQNADIFDFKLSEDELTALRAVAEKTAWSGEHPDLSDGGAAGLLGQRRPAEAGCADRPGVAGGGGAGAAGDVRGVCSVDGVAAGAAGVHRPYRRDAGRHNVKTVESRRYGGSFS